MTSPRIAIIGETTFATNSHEELLRSGATALMIRKIAPQATVTLRAVAATSDGENALTMTLSRNGIHSQVTHRDASSDTGSKEGGIRKGDLLDIWGLFDHQIVILDFDDPELRHFLTDLPAHTKPDVRLFGTLTYLDGTSPRRAEDLEVALRFDTIIGTPDQYGKLANTHEALAGFTDVHHRMVGSNLRTAILVDDASGTLSIAMRDAPILTIPHERESFPSVVARAAVVLAQRDDWETLSSFPMPLVQS